MQKKLFNELIALVGFNSTEKKLIKMLGLGCGTSSANVFIGQCGIPASTAWHNLRLLRKKKLVDFGENTPVRLTPLGEMIWRHGLVRVSDSTKIVECGEIGV